MTEMTDNAAPWPPLKKALWDVIMRANINGGYNNAWELTEDLYEAALANPEPPTEARGELADAQTPIEPDIRAVIDANRTALYSDFSAHPPAREAVDDAELIAEAMWRAEVDGFSPSASAVRKSAVWADESSNVRARWLGYARVALAALQVKPPKKTAPLSESDIDRMLTVETDLDGGAW